LRAPQFASEGITASARSERARPSRDVALASLGMVHGVPPDAADRRPVPYLRRPIEAVLFDFQGTIAQVEDAVQWVLAAAADCGVTLDKVLATSLADRLVSAGRAGGPRPSRVPPHLAEVYADRDLIPAAHRAAYAGLAATVEAGIEGLADALYERLLRPEGWSLYADTMATLQALYAAAVPVAVVSNIGFDIRPLCDTLGIARYVSAWVLSYEVGACKPDPAIFRHACRGLGVEPEHTLMVGDTPADAGAALAGCQVLILPASAPGAVHGLMAAVTLALPR
jgi:HAD superfamily hydrolase (TIGR01509 family)